MKQIIHSLVAKDGKYICMPPWKEGQSGWGNLHHPNVHNAGGDSNALYPVNAKFVDFDRTFIYGYVETLHTTFIKSNFGLMNANIEENITFGTAGASTGDTTLGLLTPTTDETGALANIFAGGYFMTRMATTHPYGSYRVISNTTYNGGSVGSTEMDIVIEDGLQEDCTAGTGNCKLNRNPYSGLYAHWAAGDFRMTVMGVTLINPTVSTHQWIQTWGPCLVGGGEQAGKADSLRDVWWHIDGSLVAGAQADIDTDTQPQYAGCILGDTHAGSYCWLVSIKLER